MVLPVLAIMWFAFGVLSSMEAKKKSRDPLAWFFAGLVFGIFGFVAALVIDEKDNRQSATASKVFDPEAYTKKCPDCAERVKLEARVCRYCGHQFDAKEVERQIVEKEAQFREQREAQSRERTREKRNPEEANEQLKEAAVIAVIGMLVAVILAALSYLS